MCKRSINHVRFHLLDLVLGVAVVPLLALPLVRVLVRVHGVTVHVLAAGPALELVAQRVHGVPTADHAVVCVLAALRRRRRDLLIEEVVLLKRVLQMLTVIVQQVWLHINLKRKRN
jgi:hypothetical protein